MSELPRFNAYVNGQWITPSDGRYFETVNPYTAKVWAEVARCTPDDANRAVEAAHAALTTGPWASMTATQRGAMVHKLGDLIRDNARELAEYEVRDNGKLLNEMLAQCNYLPQWFYYYGGLADKIEGSVIPIDKPDVFNFTRHEPIGVVAAITPWNSPLLLLSFKLAPALAAFPGVAGRMERVAAGQPFPVFVDYAHTDDALRNALRMLRDITPGRVLCVFGCGGDRDRGKRPAMTQAVADLAHLSWATADNPRKEPLERIFADMREGLGPLPSVEFVADRRDAIGRALAAAKAGDCVVIAGKGHETTQEFADTVVPFDDRQVVREILELRRGVSA